MIKQKNHPNTIYRVMTSDLNGKMFQSNPKKEKGVYAQ